MRITRVDIAPFEPRYSGSGYIMSSGRTTQLHDRLIRLTTDDGFTGIGEIVRPPIYDPAEVAALEDAHLGALNGMSLSDLPALLRTWRGAGKRLQGMVFGVELAMLDLMGRKLALPVSSLLGGAHAPDVPEYLSLSAEDPEVLAEIVTREARPFSVIQAKLSGDNLDLDLKRVRTVLDLMRPDQLLLADFNGALTADDAIHALPSLQDDRLMWEEPCNDYDDSVAVARAISAPVMFDQCLTDLSTYVRAIRDGAAAALVIKSDSIGGLSVGRTVRDMCCAAGIKLRIDGWWAGQVAGAGALHLALGTPADLLIGSIDLTDPIETDRSMIRKPRPGRVAPVDGVGLGELPENLIEDCAIDT